MAYLKLQKLICMEIEFLKSGALSIDVIISNLPSIEQAPQWMLMMDERSLVI